MDKNFTVIVTLFDVIQFIWLICDLKTLIDISKFKVRKF